MDHLEAPVARVVVRWRSAADGGRRTGPPTGPVYAATCVFPLAGDVAEGTPDASDLLSVLLEPESSVVDMRGVYAVDFLARELARPFVRVGAPMLVTEGPRVVGEATVVEVHPHDPSSSTGTGSPAPAPERWGGVLEPRTVRELAEVLRGAEVPTSAYSLGEGDRDEAVVLGTDGRDWAVHYSERGLRTEERGFATEAEACAEVLRRLVAWFPAAPTDAR